MRLRHGKAQFKQGEFPKTLLKPYIHSMPYKQQAIKSYSLSVPQTPSPEADFPDVWSARGSRGLWALGPVGRRIRFGQRGSRVADVDFTIPVVVT